ncbi:hypothetical protein [Bacillus horti]|uniref:Methyl-accepting chemotaxis protein n=1 Tax=Caldalkalibacillus horti TaxID=77523 RepID=A0ABT9W0E9_9BACI|nr:hypothetical protein [Bacillus horti]MDQ0166711.1 hypothetical protein [Bacillus horti]
MNSNFRLKLTSIMILFAIIVSLTIAAMDYRRLKEQVPLTHS